MCFQPARYNSTQTTREFPMMDTTDFIIDFIAIVTISFVHGFVKIAIYQTKPKNEAEHYTHCDCCKIDIEFHMVKS